MASRRTSAFARLLVRGAATATAVLPLAVWWGVSCGGSNPAASSDSGPEAGVGIEAGDSTVQGPGDTFVADTPVDVSAKPETAAVVLPDAPSGDVQLLPVGTSDAGWTSLGATGAPAPFSLVVADFNGDHLADVIASSGVASFPNHDQTSPENTDPSTTILLLGKDDGTFGSPTPVLAAQTTSALLVGDLNGDLKPDVVAGGQVLLGQGAGTFQAAATQPAIGCIGALGDVDGDGKLDLVGYDRQAKGAPDAGDAGRVGHGSVCLGNGDGTFQAPIVFATASLAPTAVLVGDLNGDGHADVVVAVDATQGTATASVFLAGAAGALGPEAPVPSATLGASDLRTLVLADVTKDGDLDLVSSRVGASSAPPSVSVLPGKGDGTFLAGVALSAPGALAPVLGTVNGIAAGDVNGDGHPDLLFGSSDDALLWITLAGSPSSAVPFAVPFLDARSTIPARAAGTGDFNGDGLADLLVLRGNALEVVLAKASDAFPAPSQGYPVASGTAALATADFNGDGISDFAVTGGSPAAIRVFESSAASSGPARYLVPPLAIPTASSANAALVAADFNGDHLQDSAVAENAGVGVFLGTAGSAFMAEQFTLVAVPLAMQVADVNGDGLPDLVLGNSAGVLPLVGKHDGTFTVKPLVPSSLPGPGLFAVGDVNGDKRLDIVVLQSSTNKTLGSSASFAISLGNGDGTFTALAPVTMNAGVDVATLALADINGDNFLDLLFAGSADTGAPSIQIFLGDGNATFTQAAPASLGVEDPGAIGSLVAGDFLGTGHIDLAVGASPSGGIFAVVPGNGDGTFRPAVAVRLSPGPTGGLPELLTSGIFVKGQTTPSMVLVGSSLGVVFGLER